MLFPLFWEPVEVDFFLEILCCIRYPFLLASFWSIFDGTSANKQRSLRYGNVIGRKDSVSNFIYQNNISQILIGLEFWNISKTPDFLLKSYALRYIYFKDRVFNHNA